MNKIKREVTPVESIFSLSPFAVVALLFKIKGRIQENSVKKSIEQVKKKHGLLNSVMKIGNDGKKYFVESYEGALDFESLERVSEDQWQSVYENNCLQPFEFDKKPPIRFVLLRSDDMSEILIFSHHIICDGLSLAYLGRDILENLDKNEGPEVVEAVPVGIGNLPEQLNMSGFVKKILNRMNEKYRADKVLFDFNDYRTLHRAYWQNFTHKMETIVFTVEETKVIVQNSKMNGFSVNSVLTTAICGAERKVLGKRSPSKKQTIAVSVRDRLPKDPRDSMGFYAGNVDIPFRYKEKQTLKENASRFHSIFQSKAVEENIFKNLHNWSYLDPGIIEGLNFKMLGSLTGFSSESKLLDYGQRKDLVSSLVKREKMNSFDNLQMGIAMTNLGNLNFQIARKDIELDSIIMNPGGAIPLIFAQLVVSVVTVSGKMSILLEYEGSRFSNKEIENIKEEIKKLLRSEL